MHVKAWKGEGGQGEGICQVAGRESKCESDAPERSGGQEKAQLTFVQ